MMSSHQEAREKFMAALEEQVREWELLRKLPPLEYTKIVDRWKDMALRREFQEAYYKSGVITFISEDDNAFFLDRVTTPERYTHRGGIDQVKARAAWKANLEAGIRRPDHYYVSEVFYTEEKKEKIAKDAAAHAAAVAETQADKSFWAFSLL